MDGGRFLGAIGLARQARPAGFCPACRVLKKGLDAGQELAKPTVAALVVLAVAGVAWAFMVQHSRSMAGMDGMDMGLGPLESFAATWVVMMAAMMLPSSSSRERPNDDAGGRSPLECLRARTSACG
jgi:hypothetical protein